MIDAQALNDILCAVSTRERVKREQKDEKKDEKRENDGRGIARMGGGIKVRIKEERGKEQQMRKEKK